MSKTANMFKPFDLFYKKAVKKEENAQTDVAELRTLYNQLSKKKLKKFIKKAEKDYDKYVEVYIISIFCNLTLYCPLP